MTALKILFAQIYDFILLAAIWFIAAIPYVLWQGGSVESDIFATLGLQLYLLAITYFYFTYFWILNGQTPGLRVWKLQLVSQDNFLLNRHRSNIRFLLAISVLIVGWIGLLWGNRQLLQDRLAKTKIIPVSEN